LKSIFVVTLTRPFRMFWQESIVFFTSLFLSLLYGTFYLSFSSYPIIYQGLSLLFYPTRLRLTQLTVIYRNIWLFNWCCRTLLPPAGPRRWGSLCLRHALGLILSHYSKAPSLPSLESRIPSSPDWSCWRSRLLCGPILASMDSKSSNTLHGPRNVGRALRVRVLSRLFGIPELPHRCL
jgi:hypothetical protein